MHQRLPPAIKIGEDPIVTDPITYGRRRAAISRGEREWRVEADALVMRRPGGGEKRTLWKDIIGVRLYHEPLRRRPWRYAFELHTRQGGRIVIDNAHCLGGNEYEERSSTYTPFVRAALAKIAVANPKARLLIGETQKRYFFMMLLALLAIAALALALLVTPTPLDATPFAMPVKLALVLSLLPLFWIGVLRSLPRGAPLDAVPERALPPERKP
ncbi:MAG: hypothetical protein JSS00_12680 [Proteobacteria bacterium]|nr:hypothetical protein [Pseudomonadota bacterium]